MYQSQRALRKIPFSPLCAISSLLVGMPTKREDLSKIRWTLSKICPERLTNPELYHFACRENNFQTRLHAGPERMALIRRSSAGS